MTPASAADDDRPLHPKRRANPDHKRPKHKRRDYDMLLEAAWLCGAWIEVAKNNHFKVCTADGAHLVPIPATPSGYRTLKNKRAQLARAGIDLTLVKKT